MPHRLETFGRLALRGPGGEPVQAQRRQLALLAIVAAAGTKGVHRERIIGLLWPENTPDSARHSLDQLLYSIRRTLGDDVFAGTDPLALNVTAIESDVAAFKSLHDERRHADAIGMQKGVFLEGFNLGGAPEFERWQDQERARLESMYVDCLEKLATDATSKGENKLAASYHQRITEAEPLSARHALSFMQSLAATGDIPKALDHARTFESRVRNELGIAADPAIRLFAEELRKSASRAAVDVDTDDAPGTDANQPLTPQQATQSRTPSSEARRQRRPFLTVAVSVAVMLLVTAYAASSAMKKSGVGPTPDSARMSTVAVLAFENASGDSAATYFGYGLTDALIDRLTATKALRVIQGPSAYVMRGHRTDTRGIADSLGAGNVLAGAVIGDNGMVRVAVQLIDGRDGSVKWRRTYRGEWKNRFVMQDSIEHEVPREVSQRIPGVPQFAAPVKFPQTARAYELYLRGRHVWNTPSPQPLRAMRTAIQFFNGALKEDSSYAEAYAGLAASYVILGTGVLSDSNPQAAADSARRAAAKALSLNEALPEAHLALALVHVLYDWNWEAAEREQNRALELNPFYSRAPILPSILYEWTGDFPRAAKEAERTLSTDPLWSSAAVEYGRALFYNRQFREARKQLDRARALDSTAERLSMTSGELYMIEGKYDLAEKEFARFASLSNRSARALAFVAYLAAVRGNRAKAKAIATELEQRLRNRQPTAFELSIVYAGLRDYDNAFLWLNRAYTAHTMWPLIMDPTFAELRKDRRFDELMKKMNLPSLKEGST